MTIWTERIDAPPRTHVDRIVAAFENGLIPAGRFHEATVRHDPDCPTASGTGCCSCVPVIVVQYEDGLKVTVP
jgi:hypothetical protein